MFLRIARIFVTGSADGRGQMAARLMVVDRHWIVLGTRSATQAKEALTAVSSASALPGYSGSVCGGSVALCDLIHLPLLEAALRGHRKRLARRLAAERAVRKPASRLNRWLKARARSRGTVRLAK